MRGKTNLGQAEEVLITVEAPKKDIYDFQGYYQINEEVPKEALTLENTLWANSIIAS